MSDQLLADGTRVRSSDSVVARARQNIGRYGDARLDASYQRTFERERDRRGVVLSSGRNGLSSFYWIQWDDGTKSQTAAYRIARADD